MWVSFGQDPAMLAVLSTLQPSHCALTLFYGGYFAHDSTEAT